MAHVCRDTLTRFERGETITNEAKASRLAVLYAWLRLGLGWSADALKDDDAKDVYAEDEDAVTTRPPAESGVHLIETLPAPPRLPREFAA